MTRSSYEASLEQRHRRLEQGRRNWEGGDYPPKLADPLILFQPGGQIMPTTLLHTSPPDFIPTYGPAQ